jgi:hypothetical protein
LAKPVMGFSGEDERVAHFARPRPI